MTTTGTGVPPRTAGHEPSAPPRGRTPLGGAPPGDDPGAGPGTSAPPAPAAPADGPATTRLVLPPDWELTEVSHARLRRLLRAADPSVAGVVAQLTPLPAGSSHLTAAERAALRPTGEVATTVATRVRGAVLVRADVHAEAALDHVHLERGTYLIDLGATCHDPWAPQPRPGVASPLGRPPFRRRPLVVVVSSDGEEEIVDWARTFVNGLLRNGAEGRFASPEPAHGLHLFAPCSPSAESLRALAPDLVVVTDDTAAEQVPGWLEGNRAATVMRFDPDTRRPIELASWRRDLHPGRHRGVLGRSADTKQVARLASRLLAGPLPTPPTGAAPPSAPPTAPTVTGAPAGRHPGTRVAVLGSLDGALGGTATALVELLAQRGHTIRSDPFGGAGALAADLVLVAGRPGSAATAVLRRRRARGQHAVLLIGDEDLAHDGGPVALVPPALALGRACGAVAVSECVPLGTPGTVRLGAPTLRLPLLAPPAGAAGAAGADRPARTSAPPAPGGVTRVGWFVGGPPGPDARAAAAALATLGGEPAVEVDLVGDDGLLARTPASTFEGGPGTTTLRSCDPDAACRRAAGWDALLWTPAIGRDGSALLVTAATAGVPVIAPASVAGPAAGVPASPWSTVADAADPTAWARTLGALLRDPGTGGAARSWTDGWARSALSTASSLAAVDRLLGWLERVHAGGRV